MNQVTYNDEYDDWTYSSVYNFETLKPKIIAHFEDGGESKLNVLGGVCGVNGTTIGRWLDKTSKNYKDELFQLVGKYQNVASAKVAQERRQASRGHMKDCDAKLMSHRYKEVVEDNGNPGLSRTTKRLLAGSDLKAQILALQKDYARNRINQQQFKSLVETLLLTKEVDIKEMKEQLGEIIERLK